MKKLIKGILVVCLFVGIVGFSGCKKDEPAEPAVSDVTEHGDAIGEGADAAMSEMKEMVESDADKAAREAETAKLMASLKEKMEKAGSEQTECPVMGGEINKNIFVTYKGKKVYFCCEACIAKFEADPGAYVGKLPQFQIK